MKQQYTPTALVGIFSLIFFLLSSQAHAMSFKEIDRRAKAGEKINVVFFGGSLTWGANASDPQTTSYRGLMMKYLQNKYPTAAFNFTDAAIGGTGSNLGIFRLDRDVLSKKPDLVFLDFTANDDPGGKDLETLGTYESIVHRLISNNVAVVQAYFAFMWNFGKNYDLSKLQRRSDHIKISEAYNTAQGDVYTYIQGKLDKGETTLKKLWYFDGVHPGDPGYQLFFEAVKLGFEKAIKDDVKCKIPEKPVFSIAYTNAKRTLLAKQPLPKGWTVEKTYRTALWFDGQASRWIGDVATAHASKQPESLKMEFEGTLLGLFGECNEHGLNVVVKVDGKVINHVNRDKTTQPYHAWNTKRFGPKGNLFKWKCVTRTLSPGKHTLEIIPQIEGAHAKGQLRIESVCTAGK